MRVMMLARPAGVFPLSMPIRGLATTMGSAARRVPMCVTMTFRSQSRGLTTGASKMPDPFSEPEKPRRSFAQWKADQITNWPQTKNSLYGYATLGAMGFGVYMVVKMGYSIVDYFSSISFYDVGTVAFGAGMVSAAASGAILSVGARAFTIRPEHVYKASLKKVLKDPTMMSLLGSRLKAGEFRAYTITPGGFSMHAEEGVEYYGWERWWRPRKVQMLFGLEGDKEKGMVSLEAQKLFSGQYQFNFVTVDVVSSGKHTVLEGQEASKLYRGIVKLR